MNEKFYSEFISKDFHEKISALRIAKGIKDLKFKEFVFLFVNSNDCECKLIREKELTTRTINNDEIARITNIVVLVDGCWKNYHYINALWSFIGIFDTRGKETTINLGSITLNSIHISSSGRYNIDRFSGCNITISHNYFNEYLNLVSYPIYKTIHSLLNNRECRPYNFPNKITIDIDFLNFKYDICDFQGLLNTLKEFEQKLNSHLGDTDFNPEITFKIKSCELSFDTSF